jgi:ADP-ribose pyrophosphatase YjhB (NUDIX family)
MKTAVAGIVKFKDKILIGKKIIKKGHFVSGGWHIPGGHPLENESEKDALIREIKEETNLDIKILKNICKYEIKENDVVVSWYICSTKLPNAQAGSDLSEVTFIDKNQVIERCDKRAVMLWPKEVIDYFSTV